MSKKIQCPGCGASIDLETMNTVFPATDATAENPPSPPVAPENDDAADDDDLPPPPSRPRNRFLFS